VGRVHLPAVSLTRGIFTTVDRIDQAALSLIEVLLKRGVLVSSADTFEAFERLISAIPPMAETKVLVACELARVYFCNAEEIPPSLAGALEVYGELLERVRDSKVMGD
jgi:hypothetical protein